MATADEGSMIISCVPTHAHAAIISSSLASKDARHVRKMAERSRPPARPAASAMVSLDSSDCSWPLVTIGSVIGRAPVPPKLVARTQPLAPNTALSSHLRHGANTASSPEPARGVPSRGGLASNDLIVVEGMN